MLNITQDRVGNLLLRNLPAEIFALLAKSLSAVDLPTGEVLIEAGRTYRDIYFLEAGVGSVIAHTAGGRASEVGLFGREGFADAGAVLGADCSPFETVMQLGGHGYRLPLAALLPLLADTGLRAPLLHFAQTFHVQVSSTAMTNSSFTIIERLARWLLMSHDRLAGNRVPLTHEYLAIMLGVRRAGVTMALHNVEGMRLITTRRGAIDIVDRAGLIGLAGGSYGVAELEYARLTGADFRLAAA